MLINNINIINVLYYNDKDCQINYINNHEEENYININNGENIK